MSSESVEVELARVTERLDSVLREMADSRQGRKAQYEAIDALKDSIKDIGNRMVNVERQVASAQPTIEEFITIKHKVVGAGLAGRWLWAFGAFILGVAATSREAIFAWFKGS